MNEQIVEGVAFELTARAHVLLPTARAGKKRPETLIEDLEKARWYLDREIHSLKSGG